MQYKPKTDWPNCRDHGLNDCRANNAGAALKTFIEQSDTDYPDSLGDLLCDLMHWSDRHNFDFQAAMDRARAHYETETTPPTPGPWIKSRLSKDSDPFERWIITTADRQTEITGIIYKEADADQIARAPELVALATATELDKAHDALSRALEDEDVGNDEVRDAALTVREALDEFREKRRMAFPLKLALNQREEVKELRARFQQPCLEQLAGRTFTSAEASCLGEMIDQGIELRQGRYTGGVAQLDIRPDGIFAYRIYDGGDVDQAVIEKAVHRTFDAALADLKMVVGYDLMALTPQQQPPTSLPDAQPASRRR